jgi:hypothetical protein
MASNNQLGHNFQNPLCGQKNPTTWILQVFFSFLLWTNPSIAEITWESKPMLEPMVQTGVEELSPNPLPPPHCAKATDLLGSPQLMSWFSNAIKLELGVPLSTFTRIQDQLSIDRCEGFIVISSVQPVRTMGLTVSVIAPSNGITDDNIRSGNIPSFFVFIR